MLTKCLTVCLLLLSVHGQSNSSLRLHQPDSPLYSDLQAQLQSADSSSQLVAKDLKLVKLVLQVPVSQEDGEEIGRVIGEDRVKLGKARGGLEDAIKAVERANVRAEMSLLYRSACETLDKIAELAEDLATIAEDLMAKTPEVDQSAEETTEPAADLTTAMPSIDQLLEIAGCLETLIRAHKGANEILAAIQGEASSNGTQESALFLRKKTLRGAMETRADSLQRHKELVAEAQDKVAKALAALQESAQLLAHKSQLIDSLESQILSASH